MYGIWYAFYLDDTQSVVCTSWEEDLGGGEGVTSEIVEVSLVLIVLFVAQETQLSPSYKK